MKKIQLFLATLLISAITTAQISGNVFRDYNGNATKGATSPNLEPNVPGVIINAYNASDVIIASYQSTNAAATNYSIPASGTAYNGTPGSNTGFIPNGTAVRLEFIIPNGCAVNSSTDFTSFGGVSNRTSVQFVSGGTTNVNYPINDASDYATNTNPFVFVPLLHAGNPLGGGISGSTPNQIVRFSYNEAGSANPPTDWVRNNLIGAVWGQGYSKPADRLFFSALVKRQHGLGPLGSGGIYLVNPNTTNTVTNFYNLDANGFPTRAASGALQVLPNSGAGSRNMDPNFNAFQDPTAFAQAGKTGIGDLDITNDGSTIVLTNLFDRGIYRLTLNNAANPTGVSTVNRTYLTVDGTAGGTPLATATQGILRPWGISIYQGFIYVGVVATGENRTPRLTDNGGTPHLKEQANDLVAYVYKMNLATGAWVDFNTGDATPVTPVVSIPLNYTKGLTSVFNNDAAYQRGWNAWTDDPTVVYAGSGNDALLPQPILSDIDFDDNGSIILSFTDRTGHQQGWQNWGPSDNNTHAVFSGGDVIRVGFNNSSCTYTVENNANDGNVTTAGANNGQGRGSSTNFGEFYFDDVDGNNGDAHYETATGASVKLRGDNRTLFTLYDPTDPLDEIGVAKYSGTTGASSDRYRIRYTGNPGNDGTESKGSGLGDIELIQPNAPIEIGNRVWNDSNGDGIQNPGEPSLSGVTLELFLDANNDGVPDGAAIGTVTTDVNGNYTFSSATGTDASGVDFGVSIVANQNYIIRVAASDWTGGTGAGDLAGFKLSPTDNLGNGATDFSDNDAGLTIGASPVPQIRFTTGFAGANNHNLDLGFNNLASLGDKVWLDNGTGGGTAANGVQDGTEPGIANVVVILYNSSNVEIARDTTDVNGNYLFTGLVPGNYSVEVVKPSGYVFSPQTNTADNENAGATTGSDVNTSTGKSYIVNLSAGENELDIDAGLYQTASLGDKVWDDVNANGIQDAGENGIANVVVILYNAGGTEIARDTTDANGNYFFADLTPGTYTVGIVLPVGYAVSPSTQGTDTTIDNNINPVTLLSAPVTIAGGQTNTTIDAGLYQPASLGDKVWMDTNADGIQDAGENGFANVVVILYNNLGTEIARDTTDANGNYLFSNLVPGDYSVGFVAPSGYNISAANQGTDDSTDSDADPVTGLTATVTLGNGENDLTVDAGIYQTASLGDKVWLDDGTGGGTAQDGIQNGTEAGVAGVVVILYNALGAEVARDTTDANGNYLFSNLTPGNYTVDVVKPSGYFFSTQTNTADNENAGAATGSDVNTTTGVSYTVNLSSGENELDVDAGIYQLSGIGDKVWDDVNANGIQDAGENGIANVVVILYDATGTTEIARDTTDANGNYFFDGLTAGTYTVGVVVPVGYAVSPATQGSDTATDSNIDPVTLLSAPVTIAGGQTNTTIDAGIYQPASLGDKVWMDTNADGIQDAGENGVSNVVVILYNSSSVEIARDTTDANGNYLFSNLVPGDYTVGFVAPSGYNISAANQGTDDSTDSDADPVTGLTATVTLGNGENDLTVDAGIYQTASLGDKVWLDDGIGGGTAQDGIQNGTEAGVTGVVVILYNALGAEVARDTTDANGNYLFSNLTPGNYTVEVVKPSGYFFSTQTNTADNENAGAATGSDVNTTTGISYTVNLSSGENELDVDAGIYQLSGLGDKVWDDVNANGIQDAGENGIANVVVILYNAGGTEIARDTTDANGNYFFDGLTAGTYTVGIVLPVGYAVSPSTQGTDTTIDNNINPVTLLSAPVTIAGGQTNTTIDAGLYQPASLGDKVWMDTNADGIQDAGENGVSNVVVILYNSSSVEIARDTTDANGNYLFSNLVPGDYSVGFVAPSGYNISAANQGTDDSTDSDADPVTGLTATVTLGNGENDLTVDAGIYQTASLGDKVWLDDGTGGGTAQDGIQNGTEAGVAGVVVILHDNSGAEVARDTTDANGNYLFSNLTPGNYTVEVVKPSGYFFSTQTNTADNENAGATTGSDVNTTTGVSYTVNLSSGENELDVDAGIYQLSGLGDKVWDDVNANGIQDAGENGIANVVVILYNAGGTEIARDTTDANGNYFFADLTAGTYTVGVVVPGGYAVSPATQGSDTATDSNIDPVMLLSSPVTLTGGQTDTTIDAGLYQSASLGDKVWLDTNADGIQDAGENGVANVVVILYNAAGTEIARDTTDASGNYLFSNLVPGDYSVGFVAPSGYNISAANQGTDDSTDSDADPVTGLSATVTLGNGENNLTLDAGIYQTASLGDKVWLDDGTGGGTAQDGIQNGTEAGVAGVVVILRDNTGTEVARDTTDANGNYLFSNLTPGNYTVEVVKPSGYFFSTQTNTADNENAGATTGSDVNTTTGVSYTVNLSSGENELDVDAGIYQLSGIGDKVWDDVNANGIQDAGENGIANVVVILYNAGGTEIARDTTDANGNYFFDGLTAGTYTVGIVVPGGYAVSPATQGSDTATDSNIDPVTLLSAPVTIAGGQTNTTIDAGLYQPASLGDKVWMDTNADGIQDAGENGVSNVVVILYNSSSVEIARDTTDANGNYLFSNLTPGNYTVEVVKPSGYFFSTQTNTADNENAGAATGSDVNTTTGVSYTVNLSSGENELDVDAGIYQLSGLGDKVWDDVNANGIQDAGENGIANVVVILYNAGGTEIARDTTDANGNYFFADLTAGTYTVGIVVPVGYAVSPATQGSDTATDSNIDPVMLLSSPVTLTGGQTDTTIDAGLYQSASLGDKVWLDTNADGIQDAGENGVANVVVILYNAAGTEIARDTTDASGNYLFSNLVPGDYTIEVVKPAGYLFSTQTNTTDNENAGATTGSDVNTTTGVSYTVNLTSGENELDVDAGIYQLASLGDTVFIDVNSNGIQDIGEPGKAGVLVKLLDGNGIPVLDSFGLPITTVTDNFGFYQFINLTAGTYQVQFVLPTGYIFTNQNVSDDTKDSDADIINGITDNVILQSGDYNQTIDAGIIIVPPSLGDTVFIDKNANGIQDPGEPGVAGVTVRLLDGSGTPILDGFGNPVTTVTDAAGLYNFTNLLAGQPYSVQFVLPSGYYFSPQYQGTDTTKDSDADINSGITGTIVLVNTQNYIALDAGIYQLASLGDTVFIDNNGNGIQNLGEPGIANVKVNLLYSNGSPVLDSNNLPLTTTTNANGFYEFINLLPGDYKVQFELPSNYYFTSQDAGTNDTKDSDPDVVTGVTNTVTLVSGQYNSTVDAGIYELGSIGDYVWLDEPNRNGIQDSSENGIEGVTVNLLQNGIITATTVTDSNGYYLFPNLIPGAYTVEFVLPGGGYVFSPQTNLDDNENSGASNGSDVNISTGVTYIINLSSGENELDIDAGIHSSFSLPVKLVTFNAAPQGNQVNVTWKVASEINVNRYEVFFSKDGRNFSSIGTVNAANRGNYNLLHMNPVNGLNYYRLKVIDNNGRVEFSEIKVVNFGTISSVTVYPNPAVNTINVTVSNDMINQAASINIFAADGKLMYQRKVAAINQTEAIDVSNFVNGKYTLQIIAGTRFINKSFLVFGK